MPRSVGQSAHRRLRAVEQAGCCGDAARGKNGKKCFKLL
jgi:hypothetical protein